MCVCVCVCVYTQMCVAALDLIKQDQTGLIWFTVCFPREPLWHNKITDETFPEQPRRHLHAPTFHLTSFIA